MTHLGSTAAAGPIADRVGFVWCCLAFDFWIQQIIVRRRRIRRGSEKRNSGNHNTRERKIRKMRSHEEYTCIENTTQKKESDTNSPTNQTDKRSYRQTSRTTDELGAAASGLIIARAWFVLRSVSF